MRQRVVWLGALLAASFATTPLFLAARMEGRSGQVPGTFRAHITLVPVDVRVLDRDGKLVTDLTRDDFTLLENRVRQTISHFSLQVLKPEPADPTARPMLRKIPALDLAPQNHRIFLIVLGRGRLQEPSKGLDGLIRFVRERLLPQDLVAVLAWNRATDFTTEREKIVQVLDRFKRQHERIESRLSNQLGGLMAIYGSKAIPASMQAEIDAVFRGPGLPPARQVLPGRVNDAGQIVDDNRRTTDAMQRPAAVGDTNQIASAFDRLQADTATDLPFEDYVARSAETFQDLGNLYTGIEYLRYLEVQIKVSVARDEKKVAREALVEAVVQLDRVVFKTLDDRHVAKLDISVFCADARERLVGELWQFMDLKLKDATYERMKKEGVPYPQRSRCAANRSG
jgi:VWFA-related protein